MTPQQYQLLLAIKGQKGREWATISEVAEALQIRHHAAVGLVDRCERAGLVQRSQDPFDRRVVRVNVTEEGAAVLSRLASRNRDELQVLRKALQLSFLDSFADGDRRGEGNADCGRK